MSGMGYFTLQEDVSLVVDEIFNLLNHGAPTLTTFGYNKGSNSFG